MSADGALGDPVTEWIADLSREALAEAMPERPARAYPAMLSTEADALAWARSGAPDGALVVADYQASPRGRGGWPWEVRQGAGLGFSLVMRPDLPAQREGWPYVVVTSGIADALGEGAAIGWPDQVFLGDTHMASVGLHVEVADERISWVVASVLVTEADPPRAPLLARIVEAIEARAGAPTAPVLADYTPRCRTIGRSVRAQLIPMRPGGPSVEGTAVRTLADGALAIQPQEGRRTAVPPHSLGVL